MSLTHEQREELVKQRERLADLAKALGMTPPEEGRGLRVSQDHNKKWWLCGCAEGDAELPLSKNAPTAKEALEAAEGWFAPELTELER